MDRQELSASPAMRQRARRRLLAMSPATANRPQRADWSGAWPRLPIERCGRYALARIGGRRSRLPAARRASRWPVRPRAGALEPLRATYGSPRHPPAAAGDRRDTCSAIVRRYDLLGYRGMRPRRSAAATGTPTGCIDRRAPISTGPGAVPGPGQRVTTRSSGKPTAISIASRWARRTGYRAIRRYREAFVAHLDTGCAANPPLRGRELGEHARARVPHDVRGRGRSSSSRRRRRQRMTAVAGRSPGLARSPADPRRRQSLELFQPEHASLGEGLALYAVRRRFPNCAGRPARAAPGGDPVP